MHITIIKMAVCMLICWGKCPWKIILERFLLTSLKICVPCTITIYAKTPSVQTIIILHRRLGEYLMIDTSEINHLPEISSCNGATTGMRSHNSCPICFQNLTIVLVRWRVLSMIFANFCFACCLVSMRCLSAVIFITKGYMKGFFVADDSVGLIKCTASLCLDCGW